MEYFDIRGWVTISQSYSVKQILLELLSFQEIEEKLEASDGVIDQEREDQLDVKLYQTLWRGRYLIVLDDIWSVEAWDRFKFFFPDYGNGSRIVVTTRLSNVASQFSSSSFKMNFLEEGESWDLFCTTAFPQEDFPLELKRIGKEIVQKCKGLPLSIVVIGAFLGKSSRAKEFWESVVGDINSILRSDEDELCLKLLSLSYNHLPVYLKEDEEIHESRLVKLFVAEGFLKPNKLHTLEEIAQDYLKELVDRNLILVSKWRWNGTAKFYYIHDLLREVCLREAEKEKFFHVMNVLDISQGIDLEERRIVIHDDTSEHLRECDALPSAPLARSLIFKGGPLPFRFRLLKVLGVVDDDPLEDVFQHVNIRYLRYKPYEFLSDSLPSSVSLLWNVQTLIIQGETEQIVAPPEIWNMRQLRHLEFNLVCIPDPPTSATTDQQEDCVLQNLQTLTNVVNLTFSEDVCRRIPNIEKLHISYDDILDNFLKIDLGSLHRLQSLKCLVIEAVGDFVMELVLPSSLEKLSLISCRLHWDKVTRIGMTLPHLQVLKLDSVMGQEWNLDEGAFPRLKGLSIANSDLIYWTANNSHFPALEKLDLPALPGLDAIPLDFGEIATLRFVNMQSCSVSSAVSSTRVLEEQLSLGNEDIEVRVDFGSMVEEETSFMEKVDVENFPRKNFHFDSRAQLISKIRMHARVIRAAILYPDAAV